MASLHRNSQKRIYQENGIYFVTSKTKDNFLYFKEEILCELWLEELRLCKKIKRFELLAFCLLPDHFHLLVLPKGKENISRIMQFMKRHFTRSANWLLGHTHVGDIRECRLQGGKHEKIENIINNHDQKLKTLKTKFLQKHGSNHTFPKFSWQSSFHDHLIRDENETDYHNHYEYTIYNYLKHGLTENWKYTSLNYPELIDEILV